MTELFFASATIFVPNTKSSHAKLRTLAETLPIVHGVEALSKKQTTVDAYLLRHYILSPAYSEIEALGHIPEILAHQVPANTPTYYRVPNINVITPLPKFPFAKQPKNWCILRVAYIHEDEQTARAVIRTMQQAVKNIYHDNDQIIYMQEWVLSNRSHFSQRIITHHIDKRLYM